MSPQKWCHLAVSAAFKYKNLALTVLFRLYSTANLHWDFKYWMNDTNFLDKLK